MDDLPRRPTALLKTLSIVARGSLWLLIGAWLVLILVWGSLHWIIVPRIGDFRPQLESRASQALGVTVKIGAIIAHSEGFIPSVELSDVRLFDAAGREALHLPRLLAALSPQSLWNFGFEQLYIERPQLDIRRTKDGRIQVAGLDLSNTQDADSRAADWFFSQTEIAILGGTLHWTDELRAAPVLALQKVDIVVRNKFRNHLLRLDATPPPEWGERFSLKGSFRNALLSRHKGRWREWDGELYAAFDRVDVSQLGRYVSMGQEEVQGGGALRAWVDVKRGQLVGATADVALTRVSLTPGPKLPPFLLTSLTGRMSGLRLVGGFQFSTQNLRFDTQDGVRWSGGNVHVIHVAGEDPATHRGELQADRLDLATLAQMARQFPLDAKTQTALDLYAPKGMVEKIQARWQGPLSQPSRYEAKGRVTQLEIKGGVADAAPGVQGVNVDFDLTQAGGRASVALKNGHLSLPGMFEEPIIPLTQLTTDVVWQVQGDRLNVQLPNLKFSNADAQGDAQVKWRTSEPGTGTSRTNARFPGVLDLQGNVSRADAARVHRYLPKRMDQKVRDYVRDAVTKGQASGVKFRVKGDLRELPFTDPKQGEFQITGHFSDATLAYVPHSLQPAAALSWPALTQMNGELLISRASLQLKGVSATLAGAPELHILRGEAQIQDLLKAPVVKVSLDARGPLKELLGVVVNGSPVAEMTNHVLGQASATGPAELQLKLDLPLGELEKTAVQGKLTLTDSELQILKELPRLSKARGAVHFTEKGFAISGGQARLLGGEVHAEGGTIHAPGIRTTAPAAIQFQGTLNAEGLRQATELGLVARLAQHASGSTNYAAVLGFRQGVPDVLFTSNLQGLALNVPAPLGKAAETLMPVRLQTALVGGAPPGRTPAPAPTQDQWSLDIGRVASVSYVRDISGVQARVLRGTIGVGLLPGETVPMPQAGVIANINMGKVDMDAWQALLFAAKGAASASPASEGVDAAMAAYLPTSLALRAQELTLTGRKLNQVVVGGSREGSVWRANMDARELSGYLEYRQPTATGAGSLYARLARLSLAQSTAKEVESLLEEQPISIPALDIVVEDLELRGKNLGRLEVEAVNRGAASQDAVAREWRLNKFNLILPEAVFTATGNWAVLNAAVPAANASRAATEKRRTVMNFKLDMADAGSLLNRLGMKDVIRQGKGKMEGQVTWAGSPLALDYPSLGGAFNVDVENGQFLKADPGIGKLLGVLSLQALPRRLVLDFRDVFSEGFSFDSVRGDVRIEKGMAETHNLQMKGVNAAVLMEGRADIAKETQDIKVVVVPEISAGTASLIAGWLNPVVGLGTFLAQWILSRPLIASNTQEFQITGSWTDPKITKLDAATGKKPETRPDLKSEGQ